MVFWYTPHPALTRDRAPRASLTNSLITEFLGWPDFARVQGTHELAGSILELRSRILYRASLELKVWIIIPGASRSLHLSGPSLCLNPLPIAVHSTSSSNARKQGEGQCL